MIAHKDDQQRRGIGKVGKRDQLALGIRQREVRRRHAQRQHRTGSFDHDSRPFGFLSNPVDYTAAGKWAGAPMLESRPSPRQEMAIGAGTSSRLQWPIQRGPGYVERRLGTAQSLGIGS